MRRATPLIGSLVLVHLVSSTQVRAQRHVESLTRGKVNGAPISDSTHYLDRDADVTPRHLGCEACAGLGELRTINGEEIGAKPRSASWAIWWDGDLLRELLSGSTITKWDWASGVERPLFETGARTAARGPNLLGDFLGDWREELLLTSPDKRSLRLYTTTIPTPHRIPTLMDDPQYRLAIAWQNVVYNKPPHPSFYLGHGMDPPPRPQIRRQDQEGPPTFSFPPNNP